MDAILGRKGPMIPYQTQESSSKFDRTKAKKESITSEKKWVDEQASWARQTYSSEASDAFVGVLDAYLSQISGTDLEALCRKSPEKSKGTRVTEKSGVLKTGRPRATATERR